MLGPAPRSNIQGGTTMLDVAKTTEADRSQLFPCAQCGDALVAPEWSEHVNERCVRHLWSCEACGYEFETSIYLSPQS
jgi:ribosomal protein L37AE/L43A